MFPEVSPAHLKRKSPLHTWLLKVWWWRRPEKWPLVNLSLGLGKFIISLLAMQEVHPWYLRGAREQGWKFYRVGWHILAVLPWERGLRLHTWLETPRLRSLVRGLFQRRFGPTSSLVAREEETLEPCAQRVGRGSRLAERLWMRLRLFLEDGAEKNRRTVLFHGGYPENRKGLTDALILNAWAESPHFLLVSVDLAACPRSVPAVLEILCFLRPQVCAIHGCDVRAWRHIGPWLDFFDWEQIPLLLLTASTLERFPEPLLRPGRIDEVHAMEA